MISMLQDGEGALVGSTAKALCSQAADMLCPVAQCMSYYNSIQFIYGFARVALSQQVSSMLTREGVRSE